MNLTGAAGQLFSSFSAAEAWELLRPLLLFVAGMAAYAIFVFQFYHFVARRDIFQLNLQQYGRAKHALLQKALKIALYFVEHVILFPLFAVFWTATITILLTFMSKQEESGILLLAIALVSAIRITAYYTEDLSRDLAKMLPFALLGVLLVDITYFSLPKAISVLLALPSLWKMAVYYLFFTTLLEFVLRIINISFRGLPTNGEDEESRETGSLKKGKK